MQSLSDFGDPFAYTSPVAAFLEAAASCAPASPVFHRKAASPVSRAGGSHQPTGAAVAVEYCGTPAQRARSSRNPPVWSTSFRQRLPRARPSSSLGSSTKLRIPNLFRYIPGHLEMVSAREHHECGCLHALRSRRPRGALCRGPVDGVDHTAI